MPTVGTQTVPKQVQPRGPEIWTQTGLDKVHTRPLGSAPTTLIPRRSPCVFSEGTQTGYDPFQSVQRQFAPSREPYKSAADTASQRYEPARQQPAPGQRPYKSDHDVASQWSDPYKTGVDAGVQWFDPTQQQLVPYPDRYKSGVDVGVQWFDPESASYREPSYRLHREPYRFADDSGVQPSLLHVVSYREQSSTDSIPHYIGYKLPEPPLKKKETVVTGYWWFCAIVALLCNSFLYGYHIAVVNTSAWIILAFYNQIYLERNGDSLPPVSRRKMYKGAKPITTAVPPFTSLDITSADFSPPLNTSGSKVLLSYSTGVDYEKQLDNPEQRVLWAFTVALFMFFGVIGVFSSAKIADAVGRKNGMILIAIIVIIGAVFGGLSHMAKAPELLVMSRVLMGFAAGVICLLCPLYLVEIAPKSVRHLMGNCHLLSIVVGILCAQIMALPPHIRKERWYHLFAFPGLVAGVCLLLLLMCTETPRFLFIRKGKEDKARKALILLHGNLDTNEEMDELKIEADNPISVMKIRQLISDQALRLPLGIACALQGIQQWSGIFAVLSYSAYIFAQGRVKEDDIPYVVMGTGIILLFTSLCALPVKKAYRRRRLLMLTVGVMALMFIILTISINMANNPKQQSQQQMFVILCVFTIYVYIVGFAFAVGPIPSTVIRDMFLKEHYSAVMVLTVAFNWLCAGIVLLIFPLMLGGISEFTFILFIVIMAGSLVFIYYYVPKTDITTSYDLNYIFPLRSGKKDQKTR